MGIPVFMSQIIVPSTWTVQITSSPVGSVQAIPNTYFYFLSTAKTTAGDGRSFLNMLATALTASSPGITWTVTLDANLHIKLAHNAVGSFPSIAADIGLCYALGSQDYPNTTGPGNLGITIPSTGITMPNRSFWLWCPEMLISDTGPDLFDPMLSVGIKTSAGSAARAPDSTASFVDNGIQVAAVYMFKGVEFYKRVKPTNSATYTGSTAPFMLREDYETFWQNGPRLGRRIIMWRDRSWLVGQSAPFSGELVSTADGLLRYIEYYPDASTRAAPSIVATVPNRLTHWDVSIGLWLTERGETTRT